METAPSLGDLDGGKPNPRFHRLSSPGGFSGNTAASSLSLADLDRCGLILGTGVEKQEARVSFVPHLLTFLYWTYMDETLINPSVLWIYSRAHVLALAPRANSLKRVGMP